MKFICRQVSCHNASLSVREALAFTQEQQRRILEHICRHHPGFEAMILCTCNRTEFYLYLPKAGSPDACIEKALHTEAPGAVKVWKRSAGKLQDTEAVEHLFTVACGLDSQVLGEYQIVRQLRDAYSTSVEYGCARFFLHRLMHAAFRVSREVRSKTSIGAGARSISAFAAKLAAASIEPSGASVLVVGAGENAALAAHYLYKSAPAQMIIASRTIRSASGLAEKFKNASAVTLRDVPPLLEKVDLAVFSTASAEPVITAQNCAPFLGRRRKPLLMIDIAVPRNVEPDLAKLANVQLVNIDGLGDIFEQNNAHRKKQLDAARQILHRHLKLFTSRLESLDAVGLIARLQQAYLDAADDQAKRCRRYFTPAQYNALERFAQTLAKKFMHAPISYLKASARKRPDLQDDQAAEFIDKVLLAEFPPTGDKDK